MRKQAQGGEVTFQGGKVTTTKVTTFQGGKPVHPSEKWQSWCLTTEPSDCDSRDHRCVPGTKSPGSLTCSVCRSHLCRMRSQSLILVLSRSCLVTEKSRPLGSSGPMMSYHTGQPSWSQPHRAPGMYFWITWAWTNTRNLASCTSQRYPDQAAVGGLSQHTPWYKHCPSTGGRLYCPGKKTEGLAGGGLAHSRYMAKAGLSHACLRPLGSLVLPPMPPVSLSMERSWA